MVKLNTIALSVLLMGGFTSVADFRYRFCKRECGSQLLCFPFYPQKKLHAL